ncbi:thioesterase [Desulfonema ishimotonii]|uniref:Thioesterase n=1 Tax=Desulfonema ishimotonii TaxID=45657 RepID=A0A401G2P9_9BACT|nr:hotdog fold thioesterase [Desulfonema ishimotonii]GBC63510.1 thioesterase [Desulfonema ishimotonii]
MEIITHEKISQKLCGVPLEVREGYSRVELATTGEMAADASGLIHGGFIFGLADYAAMIAVNHPNVVLGAADVKFLKPVTAGESVVAEAKIISVKGKKYQVSVVAHSGEVCVFEGEFTCFVLDQHVLNRTHQE